MGSYAVFLSNAQVVAKGGNTILPSQIEARLQELDDSLEYSYSEIFHILCSELSLDANFYKAELGCSDPFGLVGYLSEAG